MRVQLKHILPATLLFTSVLAATTDSSDETTAVDDSTTTADSSEATATEDSTATTDSSDSTATGDSDSDSTTDSSDDKKTTAKASKTTKATYTDTWTAEIQATTAPDLESGAFSLRDNNYIVVTLSVGVLAAGMSLL